MSELYFCTKCGKPIEIYKHEKPNEKICLNCCRAYDKLPIPKEYISYIADIVPIFNEELEEEFINKIVKTQPDYDQSLSYFEHKNEFCNHMEQQYEKVKVYSEECSHQPECPTCHSKNVQRISGLERGASILGLGIFSKKINKSFKCKNCGYTW